MLRTVVLVTRPSRNVVLSLYTSFFLYNLNPPMAKVTNNGTNTLVRATFGESAQAYSGPIQQLANPVAQTDTRPTPPPRPNYQPSVFFTQANTVPLSNYSSYICGPLNRPVISISSYPQLTYDPYAIYQRLIPLSNWLDSQIQPNKFAPSLGLNSGSSDGDDSIDSEFWDLPRPGIKAVITSRYQAATENTTAVLKTLRSKLLAGFSQTSIKTLRAILTTTLTSSDLELASAVVFDAKNYLVLSAFKLTQTFFVKDPRSTAQFLAAQDKRVLLAELIIAANHRGDCDNCQVSFNSADDIALVVFRNSLPVGMTLRQINNAVNGMLFLSRADLNTEDAGYVIDNLIYDLLISNPDQGLASTLQAPNVRRGRKKRQFYNKPRFDRDAALYVLYNYAQISRYCGVRTIAKVSCERVKETISTRKNTAAAKPITILTKTATTTTATTPTTTATTPTTTATATSTTATTPTTTETAPTTTETAPTTTVTGSTTTAAIPPTVQCGVRDVARRTSAASISGLRISARIVGGVVAGSCTTYPWMVRLVKDGQTCGGTILDATHILTAAHCTSGASTITATVGEYDVTVEEGTEQLFNIIIPEGIAQHPDFNFSGRTNDISVITLSEPIDFNRICAKPLCLDPTYQVTSGQKCQIAGWGVLSEDNFSPSDTLQTASISTYNGVDCSAAFPGLDNGYVSDPTRQLCAGEPAGGVDACGGDSGGPLFCLDEATNKWNLVGVVSYGEGCARPGYPGVYTYTSVYYNWIQQQLTKTL